MPSDREGPCAWSFMEPARLSRLLAAAASLSAATCDPDSSNEAPLSAVGWHGAIVAACLLVGVLTFFGAGTGTASMPQHKGLTEERYFQKLLEPDDESKFSGKGDGFSWSQTVSEVVVEVPLPAGARARDGACRVLPASLSLAVCGQAVLQGSLLRKVLPDDSDWVLEDAPGQGEGRLLRLTLAKRSPTAGLQHWTSVLAGASSG